MILVVLDESFPTVPTSSSYDVAFYLTLARGDGTLPAGTAGNAADAKFRPGQKNYVSRRFAKVIRAFASA